MRVHKHILTLALLAGASALVAGCGDDTPDRVGDGVEDALEKMEDAADKVIDKSEDAIDDINDEIHDGTNS